MAKGDREQIEVIIRLRHGSARDILWEEFVGRQRDVLFLFPVAFVSPSVCL